MSRRLLDRDFREWEAFASTGKFGLPDRAYIVFHCLTDRGQPPRFVRLDGGKAEAEREVATRTDAELLSRLEHSRLFRPAEETPEPLPSGLSGEEAAPPASR